MIVFVLISILTGSAWCAGVGADGHLETVLTVAQCRASCLDQFSHMIRNEENCMKSTDCFMCWDMCKMVTENFEIWGNICLVQDVCPAGCQLACNFKHDKNDSFSSSSTLMVRTVFDSYTDRVSIEWVPDTDLQSEGAVLYTVLLKDRNQEWNQIAQTTSHVVHIKQGLIGLHTVIRVLAANATEQISDGRNYLARYFYEMMGESTIKNSKNVWKPHLELLRRSSLGLQATIVWPAKQMENGLVEYEISWTTVDEIIEITGHLHTNTNIAVINLSEDTVYSVQVNHLAPDWTYESQSELLIIDTKSSRVNKEIGIVVEESCPEGATKAMKAFTVVSFFFVGNLILLAVWLSKNRSRLMKNKGLKAQKITTNASAFCNVSLDPTREQAEIMPSEEIAQDFQLV